MARLQATGRKVPDDDPEVVAVASVPTRSEREMKIFLGWSGERSKALAEAMREWLPLVLHYVEP